MFGHATPQINVIAAPDVSDYQWCHEAVLLQIRRGKAALTTAYSGYDNDYRITAQLQLCGVPLLQSRSSVCPTCASLLARGYGIERTDCPELREIRDAINQDYAGIKDAVSRLRPILGILSDGYYVLADVPHIPTNGETAFFANVPDNLQVCEAAVRSDYNHVFLTCTDGYPAYLYPTQSNACLHIDHARQYAERMQSPNAPRAIAYYLQGFVSALLDGHHKAYAAATMGIPVPCLTIIPMTSSWTRTKDGKKFCQFSGITLPQELLPAWTGLQRPAARAVTMTDATNLPISVEELQLEQYLTLHELTGLSAAGLKAEEITPELCRTWLDSPAEEDMERLKVVLRYLTKTAPERAYPIATDVLSTNCDQILARLAYRALLSSKTPETEQLFLNYIVSHDAHSPCWDVVTAYWADEES